MSNPHFSNSENINLPSAVPLSKSEGKDVQENGEPKLNENKSQLASSKENEKIERVKTPLFCYIAILICFVSIPILNTILFITEESNFIQAFSKAEEAILVETKISTSYYYVMGAYGLVIIIMLMNALLFSTCAQRLKMFFMVDPILINLIIICFIFVIVHMTFFGTQYSFVQPETGVFFLRDTFHAYWQDIILIILYILADLVFTGLFRILLVYAEMKRWEVILLKAALTFASLYMIVFVCMFLGEKDKFSISADHLKETVYDIIYAQYNDNLNATTPIQSDGALQQNLLFSYGSKDSIVKFVDKIRLFLLLYAGINFFFFFEMVCKMSEKEGTFWLKTKYKILDAEEEEEEEIKAEERAEQRAEERAERLAEYNQERRQHVHQI